MKRYIRFTLDIAQAKLILKMLEAHPSEAPHRRKGLVSMFGKEIARIEEDESIKRALVRSGDL